MPKILPEIAILCNRFMVYFYTTAKLVDIIVLKIGYHLPLKGFLELKRGINDEILFHYSTPLYKPINLTISHLAIMEGGFQMLFKGYFFMVFIFPDFL